MNSLNIPRRFLLTGAGFSKNFGGPLANEVWTKIFNHHKVQQARNLRSLLLNNLDYEDVYYNVITGEYSSADRQAMIEAVGAAYRSIDDALRDISWGHNGAFRFNMYGVQRLIAAFAGSRQEPGYFFTLNQDLFVERHYYNGPAPNLPGITRRQGWFTPHFTQPLSQDDFISLQLEEDNVRRLREAGLQSHGFYYVKLHGSQNWIYSGGGCAMVIGHGKEGQIQQNSLLSCYFDLFRRTLTTDSARLMIIGYGFRDAHINEVIANAVENSSLSVYVLSPQSPYEFRTMLESQHRGPAIWRGLGGYYQHTLADLLPGDQSETVYWKDIVKNFFGGVLKWPRSGY